MCGEHIHWQQITSRGKLEQHPVYSAVRNWGEERGTNPPSQDSIVPHAGEWKHVPGLQFK